MKRRFTVRLKNVAGSLIGLVDEPNPDFEIEEICSICEEQGIIWHLHPESEPHLGSENFKRRRVDTTLPPVVG